MRRMSFDHVRGFLKQAEWCDRLGSPFTAGLLRRAAHSFEDVAALFAWKRDWSTGDASALRLAGALHAAVLTERAPALAALYPPAAADFDAIWGEARRAIARDPDWFEGFTREAPQTNETRRAMAFLPVFADLSAHGPLHMLEVGASAGLNLNWDRFSYKAQDWSWGSADPAAPRIDTDWRGAPPRLPARIDVAARAGCDIHPLDPRDPAQRLRLKSYIWPDQHERLERFERAADLAAASDVRVDRADAADWLARKLAPPLPRGVSVIYHSIAWQYFPDETDARAKAVIAEAAARADADHKLAWVRFEHDRFLGYEGDDYTVEVALWPGDGRFRPRLKIDPHVRWAQPI